MKKKFQFHKYVCMQTGVWLSGLTEANTLTALQMQTLQFLTVLVFLLLFYNATLLCCAVSFCLQALVCGSTTTVFIYLQPKNKQSNQKKIIVFWSNLQA